MTGLLGPRDKGKMILSLSAESTNNNLGVIRPSRSRRRGSHMGLGSSKLHRTLGGMFSESEQCLLCGAYLYLSLFS